MPIKDKILKELSFGPKSVKQLKKKLKSDKKLFSALDSLYSQNSINQKNGLIYLNKNKENKKVKNKQNNQNLLNAKIVKLNKSYGFARVEGIDKDFFIAGKFLKGAVEGDEVLIEKIQTQKDEEAKVVSFTKENNSITATVIKEKGRFFAQIKDSPTLIVPIKKTKFSIKKNDIIIVSLLNRGKGHRDLVAVINSVIGFIDSSEKAIELLLTQRQIPLNFSKEAINEARQNIKNIDFESEKNIRRDLRKENIFTIDSDKTKDIDDAIQIKRMENGYKLSVHIADVSHFVTPKSLCDLESYERGTSIYFGDIVIPMLPKEYSNDVCSLNEKAVRFALSCDISLDDKGNIINYEFYKSIIESKIKGVYSEINSLYDDTATDEIKEKYNFIKTDLDIAKELYLILNKNRINRGSMDIESDETYIVFDEDRNPIDIKRRTRGLSEKMIEEFMLLANSCSAKFSKKHNVCFLYRVHEKPSEEKLEILKANLLKIGIVLNEKNTSLQVALSEILDSTRDTKYEKFVHMGVLRAQSKAKYSSDAIGHFGLGLEDYSHFTSPIRRYPDLAIHRVISDIIKNKQSEKTNKKYTKFIQKAAVKTSEKEVSAMQIERSADDIYKAAFMQPFVGDEFSATITSVTNFGIYVSLENTVEGLVHISKLNMINPILQEGFSLYCPISGQKYTIGDEIKVFLAKTDVLNGNVDFVLTLEDLSLESNK